MGNLSRILGEAWRPSKTHLPPEQQLIEAIINAGLTPPSSIIMDGSIHRFNSSANNSHSDKSGWYVAFNDGVPCGKFGCWRSGVDVFWHAETDRELTEQEKIDHRKRMEEMRVIREEELNRIRQSTAIIVSHIWDAASQANADHPYLVRKKIQPHNARVTGDGRLIVPLYDESGDLSSLQYISHDGQKFYHTGGMTHGKFWMLGDVTDDGLVYIAEGFATAATIHEVSGRPTFVAYSASNLVSVSETLRKLFGEKRELVIVADNDKSGVGQKYADQASAKYGVRVITIPVDGDANDYFVSGGDLVSLLSPPKSDWLIHVNDFASQPAPISWLIKGWLQNNALIMVHGMSGGGKTFVVLDMCLRIASGLNDWCDNKVKEGDVVYLAGEGHHGLRSRIAAWIETNKPQNKIKMWLSKDGCDLNTQEGHRQVATNIRSLGQRPRLIVVDTLHRFLMGDENSAQDTKTMLDACSKLMNEFNCSVLLVHHTGVADEAQHRARGSSAWRGALDIEISVVPGKKPVDPIQIIQRKSKDSEISKPISMKIEKVQIPSWLDEDGNVVSSAIVRKCDEPTVDEIVKKDSRIESYRKMFESAWWNAGAEERDSHPYLSRSAMIDYLVHKLEMTPASAETYVKPGKAGKLICDLIVSEIIAPHENGWIVVNKFHSNAMRLKKVSL